jgi:branched-chain amino acid aminotransferase
MSELSGEKYIFNDTVYDTSEDVFYIGNSNQNESVYEVIRIEEGIPLFLEDYLKRLQRSLQSVDNAESYSVDKIKHSIATLIQLHPGKNGPLKMIFGLKKPGYFLAFFMKPHLPKKEEYIIGVQTVLLNEERFNPNAKVWNQDLRNKSVFLMGKTGAYEAILVNSKGQITEASRSNVFFIKAGKIYTTPVSMVLPGITRKKVLEVCNRLDLEVVMANISVKDLSTYESCFLTGTARKIVPVKQIEKIVFNPKNPILEKVSNEFENLVQEYIQNQSGSLT